MWVFLFVYAPVLKYKQRQQQWGLAEDPSASVICVFGICVNLDAQTN